MHPAACSSALPSRCPLAAPVLHGTAAPRGLFHSLHLHCGDLIFFCFFLSIVSMVTSLAPLSLREPPDAPGSLEVPLGTSPSHRRCGGGRVGVPPLAILRQSHTCPCPTPVTFLPDVPLTSPWSLPCDFMSLFLSLLSPWFSVPSGVPTPHPLPSSGLSGVLRWLRRGGFSASQPGWDRPHVKPTPHDRLFRLGVQGAEATVPMRGPRRAGTDSRAVRGQ